MPPLFRRRQVILPTLWGCLVALVLVMAAMAWVGRRVGVWLAVSEPAVGANGGPATLLVVEGWLPEGELDDAVNYARLHGYRRLVTSGGPIQSFSAFSSYAERAAQHIGNRFPGVVVQAVPTPPTAQDRTFASAIWVRDWAQQNAVPTDTIDVYSLGAHARRTRALYRLAFGEATQVGIIAGMPRDSDVERWWTTSEASKDVLMELVGLAWMQCCFWPAPRGSHDERWGAPRPKRPASAP